MKLSRNVSYALLLLAVCLWATSGTISTLAMDAGASVMELTTFGFIFASLVLTPLVAILDRKSLRIDRKDIPAFIGFALLAGVLMNLAFFGAIDETTVAVTVIMNFTYPTMVTITSVFVFKEKLTSQKLMALPLTFAGCILVAGSASFEGGIREYWVGIVLGLLSAVGSTAYYVWGKKLEEKYSANTVVLYLFVLTAVMLFIAGNPVSLLQASIPTNAWLMILSLAMLPGIIGFLASLLAFRGLEASKASIVSSIEPMIAVGVAFVVLGETVTGIQVVGVVLIVIGIMLLRLGQE